MRARRGSRANGGRGDISHDTPNRAARSDVSDPMSTLAADAPAGGSHGRARGGSRDGPDFDLLFEEHYQRLVRALTVVAGDADAAADAVQEAFVRAHLRWRRISRYDDPIGWVRRVAINRLPTDNTVPDTTNDTVPDTTDTTVPDTTDNTSAPGAFTETYTSSGGSVTVTWTGSELRLDAISPAAGYRAEIEKVESRRIRVDFEGDDDARVEVRIDGGKVEVRID